MATESPIEKFRSNDSFESVAPQRFISVIDWQSGRTTFRANRLRRRALLASLARRSRSPQGGLRLWSRPLSQGGGAAASMSQSLLYMPALIILSQTR